MAAVEARLRVEKKWGWSSEVAPGLRESRANPRDSAPQTCFPVLQSFTHRTEWLSSQKADAETQVPRRRRFDCLGCKLISINGQTRRPRQQLRVSKRLSRLILSVQLSRPSASRGPAGHNECHATRCSPFHRTPSLRPSRRQRPSTCCLRHAYESRVTLWIKDRSSKTRTHGVHAAVAKVMMNWWVLVARDWAIPTRPVRLMDETLDSSTRSTE